MAWMCNACGKLHTLRMDAAMCHPDVVNIDDDKLDGCAAEQRNEAVAEAQNAACVCQEVFPGQIMYDYVNCPIHGTPHSKRA